MRTVFMVIALAMFTACNIKAMVLLMESGDRMWVVLLTAATFVLVFFFFNFVIVFFRKEMGSK